MRRIGNGFCVTAMAAAHSPPPGESQKLLPVRRSANLKGKEAVFLAYSRVSGGKKREGTTRLVSALQKYEL